MLLKISVFLASLILVLTLSQFAPAGHAFHEEFRLRKTKTDPSFLDSPRSWIDSVMQSLSTEEKIAQLFMIAAYSNKDKKHEEEIEKTIRECNIGGLIFFQGSPTRQALLTNRYQRRARTPLLIAMDAEWGLAMRLDSTIRYPRQMMLGSIQNEKLIYDMGCQIAWQLKRLGVQINFAPVADINNNPGNPVISSRSFGEDRANVTRKSLLYMLGMQDNSIIAVAKHFPGHGDTEVDSHMELPLVMHDQTRLDSVELFPFKELIYSGISGIMTGHLSISSLDSLNRIPSSLSACIIDSLLKQEMGFKGLIFTDAMTMKGITNNFEPDTAVLGAFLAGNDIILMPENVHRGIKIIKRELEKGNISLEDIEDRCRKILAAKYWAGLNQYKPVDINNLVEDLNQPHYDLLNRKIIESSLTVVTNKNNFFPFEKIDTLTLGSIALGNANSADFQQTLRLYTRVDTFHYRTDRITDEDSLYAFANRYNALIVSIHTDDIRASRNFGVQDTLIKIVDKLCQQHVVILDLFACPYVLMRFADLNQFAGIIVSYENIKLVQQLSAQLIFGAIPGHASLPVTVSENHTYGTGIVTRNLDRLKYSSPMECKVNPSFQQRIDSIVNDAIAQEVVPGCQILIAKDGIVFFHKVYGHHEYKSDQKVTTEDLYDLASVTKITATVPAIMKLYEEGQIDLEKPLSKYLKFLDNTNKKDISIQDILLHKAGLISWIPFYLNTLEPVFSRQSLYSQTLSPVYPYKIGANQYLTRYTRYKKGYFSTEADTGYPYPVASCIYASSGIHDTIIASINRSAVDRRPQYKYSDVGFILLYKLIESLSHSPFEEYLGNSFYKRLGTSSLCFNPLRTITVNKIVPTEDDQVFRKQLLRGYVHDPAAAMMGGISGHAGLFSNANDLAKVMQMYLNKGSYGGIKYFNPETISLFTSKQNGDHNNRRGLGFDKPETDRSKPSPACQSVSADSYGHSGFTGTLVWVDPACQLIFIFLSNRVYPDANNNKLTEMNIRTKIQQEIYNSINF
ncbi:MAG: serine hydrolase [Bacteroidales bacterium]|nr:serine hydrolase [Bacteroidales bacterium]